MNKETIEYIIELLKIIVKVISVLLPVVTSILVYQNYKMWGKNNYKRILPKNKDILFLEGMISTIFILPVLGTIVYIFFSIGFGEIAGLIVGIIMAIINIVANILFAIRMSKVIKSKEDKSKYDKINKMSQIVSILISTFIAIIFILLLLTSNVIAMNLKENMEFKKNIGSLILVWVSSYLGIQFFTYGLFQFMKSYLEKFVESVNVYYSFGNKDKVMLGIKYHDFNINNKFISFYSRGRMHVIQSKDLIKIEYNYE